MITFVNSELTTVLTDDKKIVTLTNDQLARIMDISKIRLGWLNHMRTCIAKLLVYSFDQLIDEDLDPEYDTYLTYISHICETKILKESEDWEYKGEIENCISVCVPYRIYFNKITEPLRREEFIMDIDPGKLLEIFVCYRLFTELFGWMGY